MILLLTITCVSRLLTILSLLCLPISSIASLIAVNVKTKQRGTIVVYGGSELIWGIN
jgi:hypothetical protein